MANVRKRGNAYQITVSDGYDSEGKQIKRYFTWAPPSGMSETRAEKEAQKQAVLFEERIKRGGYQDGSIKFQEFAEQWFRDYAQNQLRDRTYYRYLEMSKRVYEALGHRKIGTIRPEHIAEFIRCLSEPGQNQRTGQGLSPKTIKNYLSFISIIMETAVEWRIIPDNPCRRVKPPRTQRTEISCIPETEIDRFVELLQGESIEHRTALLLVLLLGLRRGELLGLEWTDIDLTAKVLTIRRTSQYVAQKGNYTDTTKTLSSQRSLPLSSGVIAILTEYKKWQDERIRRAGDAWSPEWKDHPRLFTQWNGSPMFNNTPYRYLEQFTKKHGMSHISLHSLRHTNATLLISEGADPKAVSALLGHSQTSTTLNIYTHALKKTQAAAAEGLSDRLLNKKRNEKDGTEITQGESQ